MLAWWLVGIMLLVLVVVALRWRAAHNERISLRAVLAAERGRTRRAESQLARQAPIALLAEVTLDALLLVDGERHVLALNDTARDLFDHDGDPVGQTLIALTRNHEIDALADDALSGSEDLDRQIELEHRLFRIRALARTGDDHPRVALALRNVTELHRLSRARREMVANISHELRTPITSIRLLTDTLQGGALGDKTQGPRLLDQVAAETSTLEQMAEELLDLAMIESGQAIIRLVPEPIGEILHESLGQMSQQVNRKKLTVRVKRCEDVIVLADREMVKRVMTNLLHNAIKFTPTGGSITVACKAKGEWVRVSVTDSGPGIPFADRERVFERFYRANRARGGPGTGLGLAIAKHIVEAHAGRIWVANRPVGKPGGRLAFTLPLSDTPLEAATEQDE